MIEDPDSRSLCRSGQCSRRCLVGEEDTQELLDSIRHSIQVIEEILRICELVPSSQASLWDPIVTQLYKVLCDKEEEAPVLRAFPDFELPPIRTQPEKKEAIAGYYWICGMMGSEADPFDTSAPKIPLLQWLKQIVMIVGTQVITIEDCIRLPRHTQAAHAQKLSGKAATILRDGWVFTQGEQTRESAFPRLLFTIAEYVVAELRLRLGEISVPLFVPDGASLSSQEIEALGSILRKYLELVEHDQLDEAAHLFHERLNPALFYRLGAYHTIIELLSPIFREGLDRLPSLSTYEQKSNQLGNLGNALFHIGDYQLALHLQTLKLKLDLDNAHPSNLLTSLFNITSTLRETGHLALFIHVLELASKLAQALEYPRALALAHGKRLGLYVDTGQWENATNTYQAFISLLPENLTIHHVYGHRMHAHILLQTDVEAAQREADLAWEKALEIRSVHEQLATLELRGEIKLVQGQTNAAVRIFQEELALARSIGNTRGQRRALGCLARAYTKLNMKERVLSFLQYDLDTIDLAEINYSLGNIEKAKEQAIAAYKWAWASGPPFAWNEVLNRSRALLDAMGVSEPTVDSPDSAGELRILYEEELSQYIESLQGKQSG